MLLLQLCHLLPLLSSEDGQLLVRITSFFSLSSAIIGENGGKTKSDQVSEEILGGGGGDGDGEYPRPSQI